ncbi:MAG: hypothetical protein Q7K41_06830 [Dehalococcoidales bacterium]|nr:hypothetical protein [Dehalococcoidales bacterium]
MGEVLRVLTVIPAEAGIQRMGFLDSSLRWNDKILWRLPRFARNDIMTGLAGNANVVMLERSEASQGGGRISSPPDSSKPFETQEDGLLQNDSGVR